MGTKTVMAKEKRTLKTIDFRKYPLPRIRHHTNPNFYLPKSRLKVDLSFYPPVLETVDWREHFANAQPPNVLDVGCGLGKFLLEYALNFPEDNILGLEVRPFVVQWLQNIIATESIGNAAVFWYSVANGLGFLESESIDKLFYLFPDPWFKKRHFKRRAFTADFVRECARVLKPTGRMYIMTDVPQVDEYHREILDATQVLEYRYVDETEWDVPIITNQEEICRNNQIPYVRMICTKRASS